ncbi:MAG: hypothetical protein AMS25_17740 [Gemmatimonas sp. SM23_52]|jgi:hypothetical protein|nr:MAG: hypothetical protein AMS25_17740 [Gemmatimonas sp. SM23_52]
MVWVLGVVVLLLMMIPLTAIVLDSEVGRALARRLGSGVTEAEGEARLKRVEEEVRYLSETVQSLQEETTFVRQLLEKPKPQESLPPGEE